MAVSPHVLVIGAGMLGAAIAWHLVRAGARVTIVEAAAPGGVATRNSLAWINASRGNPEAYFRLRHQAMAEWRRLERELPALHVAWTGGLLWGPSAAQLEAFVAEHAAWGYDIRHVDRTEMQRLEPRLVAPPDDAVHAAEEGAIEPLAAALALLDAAQALGATLIADTPVQRFACRGARVTGIVTAAGHLQADEIVLAAGAASVPLAAGIGCDLPIDNPAALLVISRPVDTRLLNGLVLAAGMDLRQTAEGRIAASAGVPRGASDTALASADLFERVRRMLHGGDALMLESHALGHRPIPRDGWPVVGRPAGIGNLYVAVTHSGITLAPAIGRMVAEEILADRRDPLIAPYGLLRFRG